MTEEKYCGVWSWVIASFCFPCIGFCPVDKRTVVSPGTTVNVGHGGADVERQERQERQDRQDRQERLDRQERQDRIERQERQDRQDRKA